MNNLPTATVVNGAAWASQLTTQLGQPVTALEPYYFTSTVINPATNLPFGINCTTAAQCVFPNAAMPTTGINPISQNLLKYILPADPSTVVGGGLGSFSTSAGKIDLHDNKFSGRVDANSHLGLLTGYYYFDRFDRIDPYWPSSTPLYPGFAIDSKGQTHNLDLSAVKTLSSASVNELRIGYFRLNTVFNRPLGGTGVTLSGLGFASGSGGAPGVYVGTPSVQGVPEIDFNNFTIGVPSRPNQLITNIYQLTDNFSKVIGTHTIKFGGQYHFNQLEENSPTSPMEISALATTSSASRARREVTSWTSFSEHRAAIFRVNPIPRMDEAFTSGSSDKTVGERART